MRSREQYLKILLERFTNNVAAGTRALTGRVLSLAELGVIRHHAAVLARSAFLRGKLERFIRAQAHIEPWNPDNEATDPYIKKDDGKR